MSHPFSRTIAAPALLALLLNTPTAQAHFFEENADCRAPKKPLEFVTELDKQAFEKKVADFRACLDSFVNKQNQALQRHQSAAEKAAQRWRTYVETELGGTVTDAPQDTPPAQ
ncbi:hypothetical protein [Motiliproteus sp. SC1-56]|uniref:hypothetical protein n=1 Tax=Motiliproteus sp. SC1-56 TaxID=2799565 RepID=UPI001A8EAB26|nr:hypothetical protein [Motiliproteus sp. SC1-56]